MTEFAFVILHYNVINETINCVESISKNIDTGNYHIIIVDNCSPNNTGLPLTEKYKNDPYVTVLLSKENVGFARGNNIGIDYARKQLNAEFICCTNNDTLLEQKNFCHCIQDVYLKSNAAVIGPKIILKNGSVQRFTDALLPVSVYEHNLEAARQIAEYGYVPGFMGWLKRQKWAQKINSLRYKLRGKETGTHSESYYNEEHTNVVLHGSCLIFTPNFFEKLDGFCPDTFLYCEENILYLDLINNGLSNIYAPSLRIRHLEDAATDSIVRSDIEKEKFVAEKRVQSLCVLIEKMKGIENENNSFLSSPISL